MARSRPPHVADQVARLTICAPAAEVSKATPCVVPFKTAGELPAAHLDDQP